MKQHTCIPCDYCTSSLSNMLRHTSSARHERMLSTGTSKKRFHCKHCSYVTFDRSNFARHEATHTTFFSKWRCDLCSLSFRSSQAKRAHDKMLHPRGRSSSIDSNASSLMSYIPASPPPTILSTSSPTHAASVPWPFQTQESVSNDETLHLQSIPKHDISVSRNGPEDSHGAPKFVMTVQMADFPPPLDAPDEILLQRFQKGFDPQGSPVMEPALVNSSPVAAATSPTQSNGRGISSSLSDLLQWRQSSPISSADFLALNFSIGSDMNRLLRDAQGVDTVNSTMA